MEKAELYEKIPKDPFSLRFTKYENSRYGFSSHWHEHTEIHLLLDGECTLHCNGEVIPLRCGDCAVINGNELHGGGQGTCTFLCVLVSPEFFGNRYIIFDRKISNDDIRNIISQIAECVCSDALSDQLRVRGYLHFLMSHLIKSHTVCEMNGTLCSAHFKKLERINQAISYIEQNYAAPISTAELAETVYLSEGYFCQLFREVMKQSAVEYLNGLRVKKAEQLLKTTAMSISEIAFCCGFSDANYFSRTYRKIKGITPTECRKTK